MGISVLNILINSRYKQISQEEKEIISSLQDTFPRFIVNMSPWSIYQRFGVSQGSPPQGDQWLNKDWERLIMRDTLRKGPSEALKHWQVDHCGMIYSQQITEMHVFECWWLPILLLWFYSRPSMMVITSTPWSYFWSKCCQDHASSSMFFFFFISRRVTSSPPFIVNMWPRSFCQYFGVSQGSPPQGDQWLKKFWGRLANGLPLGRGPIKVLFGLSTVRTMLHP